MIRQLAVTYKTAGATLTYSEMGDVVVNSASANDQYLPTPAPGLWYVISNVGAGLVTIKYAAAAITTLKQYEQARLLANSTSGWWMSKGGGAMTKEEIEAVLTGEISSHTHAESYSLPQATVGALGGIKAAARTTESSEVTIDAATGKLYVEDTSGGLVIDPDHIFVDETARDDYFTANPGELTDGLYISVGTDFQQWDEDTETWLDKTALIEGPPGPTGPEGIGSALFLYKYSWGGF